MFYTDKFTTFAVWKFGLRFLLLLACFAELLLNVYWPEQNFAFRFLGQHKGRDRSWPLLCNSYQLFQLCFLKKSAKPDCLKATSAKSTLHTIPSHCAIVTFAESTVFAFCLKHKLDSFFLVAAFRLLSASSAMSHSVQQIVANVRIHLLFFSQFLSRFVFFLWVRHALTATSLCLFNS